MSTLHNAIIVHLGPAMLLPLRWPILHQLLSIQLAPVHLSTGKGPTGTFNADGALDDFFASVPPPTEPRPKNLKV